MTLGKYIRDGSVLEEEIKGLEKSYSFALLSSYMMGKSFLDVRIQSTRLILHFHIKDNILDVHDAQMRFCNVSEQRCGCAGYATAISSPNESRLYLDPTR